MSNKPEKYLPGRPCRDCGQAESKVAGSVLMEPNGNSTIRQIVEDVMMALGANNHDFRLRDKLITENAHYIQRHSDEFAAAVARREAETVQVVERLVRELDLWNTNVEKIIGRQIDYKWEALEDARKLIQTGGGA